MPEARLTVWGEAECRRLHEATLELLADTGVDVRYEPALELFRAAGASVDGRRVRIPARLVEDALASAPREWALKPRGGDTAPLILRDGEVYYGTGSDVLYVRDPESGERRRVRRADVEGMAALCEMLPNIDFIMSMGLPEDAPQGIDDLVQVVAMLRGTRKPLLVAPARRLRARAHAGDGGSSAARRRASASTPCRRRRSCTTPTRSPRSSAAPSCSSRSSTPRRPTWERPGRGASPGPCSSATPRP